MTRVIATLINSPYNATFADEIEELRGFTDEILAAAFSKLRVRSTRLLSVLGR